MFSVEHASSTGPAVMEEGRRGRATGFLFSIAKKFPQVLASRVIL